jgi:hypothetical protein
MFNKTILKEFQQFVHHRVTPAIIMLSKSHPDGRKLAIGDRMAFICNQQYHRFPRRVLRRRHRSSRTNQPGDDSALRVLVPTSLDGYHAAVVAAFEPMDFLSAVRQG